MPLPRFESQSPEFHFAVLDIFQDFELKSSREKNIFTSARIKMSKQAPKLYQ
jgi:hypothetical protein